MTRRIPCTIMRGGTSKGVFVRAADLPQEPAARDTLLLRLFGSPDPRQIDGLGSAFTAASKVAIIAPPSRSDADLDYTFGQVEIAEPAVDYDGICGNIAAAVASYAVAEGFVEPRSPLARVRIHQTNTGRLILGEVPVADGRVLEAGDFAVDGVPGTGARIALDFADATGSVTGRLLPTGAALDRITLPDGSEVAVTVVDVANLLILVGADAMGIAASLDPAALERCSAVMARFEAVRRAVAARIGLRSVGNSFPLIIAVGPPAAYESWLTRAAVPAAATDFWAREWVNGKIHRALSGTASVGAAVAAALPGSVIAALGARPAGPVVRIGHPAGTIAPQAAVEAGDPPIVRRAVVGRTARRILDGLARVPDGV